MLKYKIIVILSLVCRRLLAVIGCSFKKTTKNIKLTTESTIEKTTCNKTAIN